MSKYNNLDKYLEKKGMKNAAEAKKAEKGKLKGKDFKILTVKEKDELLEQIAKDLGYL
jgi:hypothetical protein